MLLIIPDDSDTQEILMYNGAILNSEMTFLFTEKTNISKTNSAPQSQFEDLPGNMLKSNSPTGVLILLEDGLLAGKGASLLNPEL